MYVPSATVLVIASEVLSAKIPDENGPWLARRLRELGVELSALLVLPDRSEAIVEAVSRERLRATWVFTSGGVGPTHDDLTVAAVAKALGRPLRRHPDLEAALRAMHRRHRGDAELPPAALRMADVPEGTQLAGDPAFPTLVVENVVMLPGVPQFLRWQFERIAATLAAGPFRLASVYLRAGEDEIAPLLSRVAAAHPGVAIGSYPRFDDADHRVRVTLESKDEGRVGAAVRALLGVLPPGAVVRTEEP